jgi:uncharacterized membrane protein YoaK (UPF0700 family)
MALGDRSPERREKMPASIESSSVNDSPELLRFERRLPPLLSVIAGIVDVIGFLSLGLFTAHITGNLVVIAALLVRGGPPNMAQVLSVPVFVIAVAAVWRIAKALKRRGPALARPLLLIQFLLLTCVLIFSVIYSPAVNPHGWMSVVIAMIAVSAMACQFALLRVSLPVAPSTAVMTGNLTNAALSLLDTLSRSKPLTEDANERLKKTLKLVFGFFAGCVAGAAAVSWLGDWAWLSAVILAGLAVVLR